MNRSLSQNLEENEGFDQILQQLRQIVARLEQGNLPLEQALLAFEEGVRLSKRGSEILESAEHRVELLIRNEDGSAEIKPLDIDIGGKNT